MGSSQTFTIKYVIQAKFEIEGVVEKPDVIGAVFGQTEGLFGPELDLRELQKSGRIGRIEIDLHSKNDKTTGIITIPTSLDRVSTALIAASVEAINRVGPCAAKVMLEKIEDVREARRKVIIDRAKEILHKWTIESMPSVDEVFKEVSNTLKIGKVEKYGEDELPAGPELTSAKEIIIVEGRADIINLMRCGILNTIAIEDLFKPKKERQKVEVPKEIAETAKTLEGTLEAVLLNDKMEQVEKLPVSQLAEKLQEIEGVDTIVFDGIITQRIVG